MTHRVQSFRADATGQIPAPGTRAPGELWANFADLQLGLIDPLTNPQKLIAVRFWAGASHYHVNDIVAQNGSIWVANGDIPPGAFDPSQWTELGGGGGGGAGGGPFLPLAGGTMLGSLLLAHDPTAALEAATKEYVDALVTGGGGGSGGPFLPLAGGTMLGDLVLFRDPTTTFGAATKGYVDAHAGTGGGAYLPLAGGTMTGPIVLAADPTTSSQAANKHYVDTAVAAGGGSGTPGNIPTGGVIDWAGFSTPPGYVKCDGSAYLSTDPLYVALFGIIGTAYGSAPGGYFKVPDLRDRVTVGAGSSYTIGNTGGAKTVALSVGQLATHTHLANGHIHASSQDPHRHALVSDISADGTGSTTGVPPSFQLVDAPGPTVALIDFTGVLTDYQTPNITVLAGYETLANTGSSQPHENMPPYIAMTKIIKL